MALSTKPKPAVPPHHKKRTGQHHKQTRHYARTYWPYLPLLAVVIVGMIFNLVWSNAQRGVLGYAAEMSTSSLLQTTNTQRINHGYGALALNGQLSTAAQAKANDMAGRNYWSHNTPDGATPWTFIIQAGYHYQAAGENLAYGFNTSGQVIDGWLNSPEHKANMLNGGYADVGFGVANSANFQGEGPQTIVVAMYGKQIAPAPQPAAPAPTTKPTPAAPAPQNLAQPEPAAPTTNEEKAKEANAKPIPATKTNQTPRNPGTSATTSNDRASEKEVSRIQLVSQGNAPWSAFAVSSLGVICVMLFLFRHSLAWRRVVIKGERFIVKRHLLDIILLSIGVLGFILTRTSGTIH